MVKNMEETYSFGMVWGILRARWQLIVLCLLLSTVTAISVSWLQTKIYRSTTFLLVAESKTSDLESKAPNYVYYELMHSYETLLNNDFLIQKTIRQFGLEKPPYGLTVDSFRRRHFLQVEQPRNTRLLQLILEFPDAKLAADMANFIARSMVEFNEEMNDRDITTAQSFLKVQIAQASKELAGARHQWDDCLKETRLSQLHSRRLDLSTAVTEHQREMDRLQVDQAREIAKNRSIEEEIEKTASTNFTATYPVVTAIKEGSLKPDNPSSIGTLINEQRKAQFTIQQNQAALGTLNHILEGNRRQLAQGQKEEMSKENQCNSFSDEYSTLSEGLAVLQKKFQETALAVKGRSIDLKLIAPAMVSLLPVRPRPLLNVLLAGFLGLLLSLLLIFLLYKIEVSGKWLQKRRGDKATK
jgi:uncharacterized protein involved in exopolysaccharide biosynthesis